jgi:hypothetical protein
MLVCLIYCVQLKDKIMGDNLAVIVSSKNERAAFEYFVWQLGLEVEEAGKVSFAEALKDWKEDFVDVFFPEKGTIIFAPMRTYQLYRSSYQRTIAAIIICDNPMTIELEYAQGGHTKRRYIESDGEIFEQEGEALPFEQPADYLDKISACIEEITGRDLWSYQQEEWLRFKIIS